MENSTTPAMVSRKMKPSLLRLLSGRLSRVNYALWLRLLHRLTFYVAIQENYQRIFPVTRREEFMIWLLNIGLMRSLLPKLKKRLERSILKPVIPLQSSDGSTTFVEVNTNFKF